MMRAISDKNLRGGKVGYEAMLFSPSICPLPIVCIIHSECNSDIVFFVGLLVWLLSADQCREIYILRFGIVIAA